MSWDWVPPRPGEEQGGPSPALRRTVTVLAVLFTGVLVLFYASQGLGQARDACVRDRPAGVAVGDVGSQWRWLPPGYDCTYPSGEVDGEVTSALRPAPAGAL
ncbi:hypothetical protein [Oerskovia flava]|uniref:hypothetical protein n=1 Tax=Oerskovia flava TaxID=2986422 RepID=UPI0022401B19|nr:hypothetical protein [Oerskovia sp. JB1-3-2]